MSENTSETNDSGLLVRRIINFVISMVTGVLGCIGSVRFILGTTMSDYGAIYIIFTILSIAAGVAIWLDHEKVLNTKILPH